jgi:hypothetical protein
VRSPVGVIHYTHGGEQSERDDASFEVDEGVLTIFDYGYDGDPPVQVYAPGEWADAWYDG